MNNESSNKSGFNERPVSTTKGLILDKNENSDSQELKFTEETSLIVKQVLKGVAEVIEHLNPTQLVHLLALISHMVHMALKSKLKSEDYQDFQLDPRDTARITHINNASTQLAIAHTPEFPLKPFSQVELSPKATELIKKAKRKEKEKMRTLEGQINWISSNLSKMFEMFVDLSTEELPTEIYRDAELILKKRNPSVEWIKKFLLREESFLHKPPFDHLTQDDIKEHLKKPDIIGIIFDAVKLRKGPSNSYSRYRSSRHEMKTLTISKLWNERYQMLKEMGVDETDSFLTFLAESANEYTGKLFNGDHTLHPKVEAVNNLDFIQKIAQLEPFDEDLWNRRQSADIKISTMHRLLLIDSETDFELNSRLSAQLAEKLNQAVREYPMEVEGKMMNVPILNYPAVDGQVIETLEHSTDHIPIWRLSVSANGKTKEGVLEKIIVRGFEDLSDIYDLLRFRIELRPEQSLKPGTYEYLEDGSVVVFDESDPDRFDIPKIEANLEKIFAIIVSLMGTDILEKTVKWSVNSGGTNPNSDKNHRTIHATFLTKSTSREHGSGKNGEPLTKTIHVECQVGAFLQGLQSDIEKYSKAKGQKCLDELGATYTYDKFIIDLMDTIIHDFKFDELDVDPKSPLEKGLDPQLYKFHCKNRAMCGEVEPEYVDIRALLKHGYIPSTEENNYEALLLLEILTARDSNGKLVNANIIDLLKKDHMGKLIRAVEKCKKWTSEREDLSAVIKSRAIIAEQILLNSTKICKQEYHQHFEIEVKENPGDEEIKEEDFELKMKLLTTPRIGSFELESRPEDYEGYIDFWADYDRDIYDDTEEDNEKKTIQARNYYYKKTDETIDHLYRIEEKADGSQICYAMGQISDEGGKIEKIPIWEIPKGQIKSQEDQRIAVSMNIFQHTYYKCLKTGRLKLRVSDALSKIIEIEPGVEIDPHIGLQGQNLIEHHLMEEARELIKHYCPTEQAKDLDDLKRIVRKHGCQKYGKPKYQDKGTKFVMKNPALSFPIIKVREE